MEDLGTCVPALHDLGVRDLQSMSPHPSSQPDTEERQELGMRLRLRLRLREGPGSRESRCAAWARPHRPIWRIVADWECGLTGETVAWKCGCVRRTVRL